ncbi:uncharacterized protein LOC108666282 [Hyalella azteca]|uniref:Uncharacterized protein LOC108666282 n=1 Tax=Hyalella azteca TaxID=294128 RepID=A0A8B7N5M4_HYAAZ|nr:uncharacterized protein LOC108666282 [Hyalella azteca]
MNLQMLVMVVLGVMVALQEAQGFLRLRRYGLRRRGPKRPARNFMIGLKVVNKPRSIHGQDEKFYHVNGRSHSFYPVPNIQHYAHSRHSRAHNPNSFIMYEPMNGLGPNYGLKYKQIHNRGPIHGHAPIYGHVNGLGPDPGPKYERSPDPGPVFAHAPIYGPITGLGPDPGPKFERSSGPGPMFGHAPIYGPVFFHGVSHPGHSFLGGHYHWFPDFYHHEHTYNHNSLTDLSYDDQKEIREKGYREEDFNGTMPSIHGKNNAEHQAGGEVMDVFREHSFEQDDGDNFNFEEHSSGDYSAPIHSHLPEHFPTAGIQRQELQSTNSGRPTIFPYIQQTENSKNYWPKFDFSRTRDSYMQHESSYVPRSSTQGSHHVGSRLINCPYSDCSKRLIEQIWRRK